jgi:hypothetical protein
VKTALDLGAYSKSSRYQNLSNVKRQKQRPDDEKFRHFMQRELKRNYVSMFSDQHQKQFAALHTSTPKHAQSLSHAEKTPLLLVMFLRDK